MDEGGLTVTKPDKQNVKIRLWAKELHDMIDRMGLERTIVSKLVWLHQEVDILKRQMAAVLDILGRSADQP